MKTAYAVNAQSLIGDWPYHFYLIDDNMNSVAGMFDSFEELQVFADLHDYTVKELSEAEPFSTFQDPL